MTLAKFNVMFCGLCILMHVNLNMLVHVLQLLSGIFSTFKQF